MFTNFLSLTRQWRKTKERDGDNDINGGSGEGCKSNEASKPQTRAIR